MDIKIKQENAQFNYCVRALIEQDGKVLLVRVDDAAYYHLPGGHVEIGETSVQALQREIQEKVGLSLIVEQLVVINEQFYQKKDTAQHSLIFYYRASPQNKIKLTNTVRMEQGKTRLIKNELRWVTREELKNIDLRPELIKKIILKNNFTSLQHIIG